MRLLKLLVRRNNCVMVATHQAPVVKTYIGGIRRRYLLLGQEYGIVLRQGARNSLKIEKDNFVVTLSEMTKENFERFIEDWYRRTARKIFLKSVAKYISDSPPQIKIYKMRRAWGRCYYRKNIITINLHLVKCPEECIDYIVLHELCHFTHNDHSKDFYKMVTETDSHWKQKDARLKEFSQSRVTLLQRLHI